MCFVDSAKNVSSESKVSFQDNWSVHAGKHSDDLEYEYVNIKSLQELCFVHDSSICPMLSGEAKALWYAAPVRVHTSMFEASRAFDIWFKWFDLQTMTTMITDHFGRPEWWCALHWQSQRNCCPKRLALGKWSQPAQSPWLFSKFIQPKVVNFVHFEPIQTSESSELWWPLWTSERAGALQNCHIITYLQYLTVLGLSPTLPWLSQATTIDSCPVTTSAIALMVSITTWTFSKWHCPICETCIRRWNALTNTAVILFPFWIGDSNCTSAEVPLHLLDWTPPVKNWHAGLFSHSLHCSSFT